MVVCGRGDGKRNPMLRRRNRAAWGMSPPSAGSSGGNTLSVVSYMKKMSTSCAIRMRRNMERGYTVEYPTAGALLPAVALAKASAGGSVFEPAMSPISVK